MRKLRFIAPAALAALGLMAATAQAANTYDFTAKVPSGGSKSKPKTTGFTFDFAINDDAGNMPSVVKSYKFTIGGMKVNTKAAKATCTVATITAANGDSKCSPKAIIGSGSVSAIVGIAGQPQADKVGSCALKLTAYAAGPNKAALFLKGGPAATPSCLVDISQAIDAKWSNGPQGASLTFEVPDALRHQVGLDVPVLSVKSSWKAYNGKGGGYLQSIGCKGQRAATAVFTDEAGTATPVSKTIGKC